MRFKIFGLVAPLILFGAAQVHATTVYQFDTLVSGTVVPAGSVDLSVNGSTATFVVSLPTGYSFLELAFNLNSGATVSPGNYVVTPKATANFGGGYGNFNTMVLGSLGSGVTFTVSNFTGLSDIMVGSTPIWFVAAYVTDANMLGVMAADEVQQTPESVPSQTPLPATLPLLAGGAGVLGLLGWRRKHGKTVPRR